MRMLALAEAEILREVLAPLYVANILQKEPSQRKRQPQDALNLATEKRINLTHRFEE